MRRPIMYLIITLSVLVLAALPAAGLKLYSPDMRILPADTGVRQGFTMLENSFRAGTTSPISIVLHNETNDLRAPEYLIKLAALQTKLEQSNHVVGVSLYCPFSLIWIQH